MAGMATHNALGVEMKVVGIHVRTDKVTLNERFEEPMWLDDARAYVREKVKGHTVWNAKLHHATRGHFTLD